MAKNKKIRLLIGQYALLLICLLTTFLFIIPQSDIFIFKRSSGSDFGAIFDYSLNYGNGRLLGNIIGTLFAHYFDAAWVFVSVCLFVTVFLLNQLLFKQSVYTVFPLAILIIFPSSGAFSECYSLVASFVNFFVPITFALIALFLCKTINERRLSATPKIILEILLFVVGFASCLFSENSTIVFFTVAFLMLAYKKVYGKKIGAAELVYFLSTLVAGITMVAIPILTKTSQKMDDYRSVSTGIKEIAVGAVASFTRFAEIFNSFTLLLFVLSAALILCLMKQKSNQKFKTFAITFFAVYPVFAILMRLFAYQSRMLPVLHIFETLAVAVYLIVFLFTIWKIDAKEQRNISICGFLVLLSSIAPMLLVSQYGHRTYLTSYFTLIFLAFYLLRENAPKEICALPVMSYLNKKMVSALVCIVFVFTSGYTAVQMIYNYNFYVIRTAYIEKELACGSKEIDVPVLPFIAVSIEDEWPNIVGDIAEDKTVVFNEVSMTSCENAQEYEAVFSDSIVHNVMQALENRFG